MEPAGRYAVLKCLCLTKRYAPVLQIGLTMDKKGPLDSIVALSLKLTMVVLSMLPIGACHTGASLSTGSSSPQEAKQSENPYANAEITTKILPSVNNTFGYDILLYGRPLVHQPNIPGLPGNEGFITQERAQTIADFVVKKIRNNEMPPTVTMEDLNTMSVLK
jgi:hypothetical protein